MTPTTLDAVRAALSTAIAAIVPTRNAAEKWRAVDGRPSGPESRRFYLEFAIPSYSEEEGSALWCGGYSLAAELRIWTAYTGRDQASDALSGAADTRDLWAKLSQQSDPTITGLASVSPPEWVPDTDAADGWHRGHYACTVTYLGSED